MEILDLTLSKVLEAREHRALLRTNIAKSGFDSLSLTLNIPGYPKSNKLLSYFFSNVLEDLVIYLQANRIYIDKKNEIWTTDEAGDFYLVPLTLNKNTELNDLKQLTEFFEEKHKLGRLIDIDIFDKYAKPVSSGKEKPCYFCGKYSAISCMRNKRHSYQEIRNKIFDDISLLLEDKTKENLINKISGLAQRALLYEISISNKPGLVCFEGPGAHKDMNFFSFLNSTTALSPFFKEFCTLGYDYTGTLKSVLPKIREIGLRAEKAMFSTTDQANTHKGIIFLFGISLFASTKIISENTYFSEIIFQETVKKIGKNLVKNELDPLDDPKTHGEEVFKQYGKIGAGIRQEIETGLATIFQTAIPYLSENLKPEIYKDQIQLQKILLHGLLLIMSKNNDTNILYRSNLEKLNHIKELSKRSISDPEAYDLLYNFCNKNRLSPGGSADLLAISLFLHFIKELAAKKSIDPATKIGINSINKLFISSKNKINNLNFIKKNRV